MVSPALILAVLVLSALDIVPIADLVAYLQLWAWLVEATADRVTVRVTVQLHLRL